MWATGNGGSVGDDCSCDGYVSSIYTLSVGCISDRGLSTYFSEVCPSTMAVVFSGGSHYMPGDVDYKSPKVKVVSLPVLFMFMFQLELLSTWVKFSKDFLRFE